jgi:hypothetical protein
LLPRGKCFFFFSKLQHINASPSYLKGNGHVFSRLQHSEASPSYLEGDGDVLSRLQPFHSQPGFLFLLEPPKKQTVQMLVGQIYSILTQKHAITANRKIFLRHEGKRSAHLGNHYATRSLHRVISKSALDLVMF